MQICHARRKPAIKYKRMELKEERQLELRMGKWKVHKNVHEHDKVKRKYE